jgi:hypothetical protein
LALGVYLFASIVVSVCAAVVARIAGLVVGPCYFLF